MKAPVLAACFLAITASASLAQTTGDRALALTFHEDGTVSLDARGVTTREILAEWARACRCYVVNADRLAGPPSAVPVAFERVPQAVVLRSLLRQAAGYTLTPRRTQAIGPSDYETIYILPAAAAAPAFAAAPQRPAFQMPTPGSPDDEIPPVDAGPITAQEPAAGGTGTGAPGAPAGPTGGGLPAVNVPGVRVVPITPVSSSPSSRSDPAPGGVTPAPTPTTAP